MAAGGARRCAGSLGRGKATASLLPPQPAGPTTPGLRASRLCASALGPRPGPRQSPPSRSAHAQSVPPVPWAPRRLRVLAAAPGRGGARALGGRGRGQRTCLGLRHCGGAGQAAQAGVLGPLPPPTLHNPRSLIGPGLNFPARGASSGCCGGGELRAAPSRGRSSKDAAAGACPGAVRLVPASLLSSASAVMLNDLIRWPLAMKLIENQKAGEHYPKNRKVNMWKRKALRRCY